LLNGTFFHIMKANQFLENDRKFFRLTAPVCILAPKVRMGKEQVAEVARLPEKTAEDNSKEFLSDLPRGSGGKDVSTLERKVIS
jgi:hypothetical protein